MLNGKISSKNTTEDINVVIKELDRQFEIKTLTPYDNETLFDVI
jgi:hypothetical protein